MPQNCLLAMPGKYPMHPLMPTKGILRKSIQWVYPYHLVTPHLTLQVQSVGLRLHGYLSQPSVSPEKGRLRDTSILDPIPIHKAHQLISSDNAQVTIEPQL